MDCVILKVGKKSGNRNGCARKSRKGIGKGKMAAPLYKKEWKQKRKDDSVPVRFRKRDQKGKGLKVVSL